MSFIDIKHITGIYTQFNWYMNRAIVAGYFVCKKKKGTIPREQFINRQLSANTDI